MKLKYIIASLATALLCVATSCQKEKEYVLDNIKLSSSVVKFGAEGGSKAITVSASEAWKIQNQTWIEGTDTTVAPAPKWLTIDKTSGAAGETKITLTTAAATAAHEIYLFVECGKDVQRLLVIQEAGKVELKTCADVFKGTDGQKFRIKGVCTKITGTYYGNWYINDGTAEEDVYIYGTVDETGAYNWEKFGIEVGDVVTVEGPLTIYKGTYELVDVSVISVEKSLIKCDSLTFNGAKFEYMPIEGGEMKAQLTCKGQGISVDIPEEAQSWIQITGINTGDNTVTFSVAENKGGDRSAEITFKTTDGKKDYNAVAAFTQKGSIVECKIAEFLEKPVDASAKYKVTGIITKVVGKDYGNVYIKDATGEVYVYGIGAKGEFTTLGLKAGDIVTLVGVRAEFSGTAQMSGAAYQSHKPVTTMTAAAAIALEDEKDTKDPQNYVKVTGKVTKSGEAGHKFDLETYGAFDLVDESGSAYVYEVSTGWNGERKVFGTLGVKEGDIITIVAYKTSYKGTNELIGMYVSHETPAPVEDADYTILAKDLPTAYPSSETTQTMGGVDYLLYNVANYGYGIQMKKGGSYIKTKADFAKKIAKIKIYAQEDKAFAPANLTVAGGSTTIAAATITDTVATYDFSAGDYKSFSITNASTGACYASKIEIILAK